MTSSKSLSQSEPWCRPVPPRGIQGWLSSVKSYFHWTLGKA